MGKDEKTKQAIGRQKNKMPWQVSGHQLSFAAKDEEKKRNPVITDIGTCRTSVCKIKDDE